MTHKQEPGAYAEPGVCGIPVHVHAIEVSKFQGRPVLIDTDGGRLYPCPNHEWFNHDCHGCYHANHECEGPCHP